MKLNHTRTAFIGLGFLTISAFWQLYNNQIPIMIENLIGGENGERANQTLIGLIMSLDNLLALFMLPLFGDLSDKTRSRFGKRTPYIIIGTTCTVVFMLLLPLTYAKNNAPLFFLVLGCMLFAASTYRAPTVALMPDVTPKSLRSKANAIINLMGALGVIITLVFTMILLKDESSYFPIFLIVGSIMILSVVILLFAVNENKLVLELKQSDNDDDSDEINPNTGVKVSGKKKVSLFMLLISVFFWFMSYGAIESAISRYTQRVWGMGKDEFAIPLIVGSVVALVSYIPVGIVSGKLGRKKTIIIGLIVLVVSFMCLFSATSFHPVLYIFFGLVGVSWAAVNVNSYPMVVDMSHGADVGRYTGLYYTFTMAALIATPVLSGLCFDVFVWRYRVLFPYSAVFMIFGLVTLLFVKHGDSKPTPPKNFMDSLN